MGSAIQLVVYGAIAFLAALVANLAHDTAMSVHAIIVGLVALFLFVRTMRAEKKPAEPVTGYNDGVIRAGVIATAFWGMAGFLAGGLTMTLYPLSMAHTHDWLDVDQMTPASSALVMVYGGGAMLGPLGTGVLMSAFGTNGFAYYLIALCLALSAYAVYRITRREAPDSTEDYLMAPAAISAGERGTWGLLS